MKTTQQKTELAERFGEFVKKLREFSESSLVSDEPTQEVLVPLVSEAEPLMEETRRLALGDK